MYFDHLAQVDFSGPTLHTVSATNTVAKPIVLATPGPTAEYCEAEDQRLDGSCRPPRGSPAQWRSETARGPSLRH